MSESRATITCEDIFGEESSTSSTSNEEALSQTAQKARKPPGTALIQRILCCTEGACCPAAAVAGEVGLLVEDIVDDATERWTAAPIDSENEDAECRAAMQNAETAKEDSDVSEHVVPMTLC